MPEKEEKVLPSRKPAACRPPYSDVPVTRRGKTPQYYNALPRDCKFTYMTAGYYATGFGISDIYKTEVDFTEYRNLWFIEDPKEAKKWGGLKARIPYPESRITDLPGTRDLHYRNYCLRSLTAESAKSWRKSIRQTNTASAAFRFEDENKPEVKN